MDGEHVTTYGKPNGLRYIEFVKPDEPFYKYWLDQHKEKFLEFCSTIPNGGRKTRRTKKRRLSKRKRAYKSRSKLHGKSFRR